MSIGHISDTARWVALYRAMESERPDAHFRDPWARALAGAKGEEIVRGIPRGEVMGWPLVVRTVVIDEMVARKAAEGVDLVVNLAAGLDTRPWRMELPPTLRWVDVDLPGILEHKAATLEGETPRCDYRSVPADLTDRKVRDATLDRVTAGAAHALVITEGLLVYLDAETVTDLGRSLAAQPACRWWITDVATPMLRRIMARYWGDPTKKGNAPFRFFPEEGAAFFAPLGWKEEEFRSTGVEARRLDRTMPGPWYAPLLRLITPRRKLEQMRRMAGTVLLTRDGNEPAPGGLS